MNDSATHQRKSIFAIFRRAEEITNTCTLGESTLVSFRKRLGENVLAELNELLIPDVDDDDDSDNSMTGSKAGSGSQEETDNAGTLIMDATCTPADIRYPQNMNLLNKTREKLEYVMDELHDQCGGTMPLNYHKTVRKEFLKVNKAKKLLISLAHR